MSDAAIIARFARGRARERLERVEARRAALLSAVPALARLLVDRGARRVWLFGSLAWGRADERSDLDLAVEGLPAEALLEALGALLTAAPCAVDLVRMEEAPGALASRIRAEGRRLHG